MLKKVAIVGTASGWERAPWDDPEWEMWGLNDGYLQHGADRHCTRWFELHGDTPLTRARRRYDHFERIAEMEIPVYYLHGAPPAPQALKLDVEPLARIGRDYFACTNAYQIALALSEGFTSIALYGTPLMSAREAAVERPCVSWWLGLAEGRGVTVTVDHDFKAALLVHPHRYAYHDAEERETTYWLCKELYNGLYEWLDRESTTISRSRLIHDASSRPGPAALVALDA